MNKYENYINKTFVFIYLLVYNYKRFSFEKYLATNFIKRNKHRIITVFYVIYEVLDYKKV